MHELATAVYQIKGHIKGRTLLPFPQGAANIDEEERKVRESDGKEVDTLLKNNIEAIVSKWAYQVNIAASLPGLKCIISCDLRLTRSSVRTQQRSLIKATILDP